jgi:hypothetical protein
LEKAEKKVQKLHDFLQKKQDDLRMEVAADMQAALEAGVSASEIDAVIKSSSMKGKNVTKSAIAEARRKLQEGQAVAQGGHGSGNA